MSLISLGLDHGYSWRCINTIPLHHSFCTLKPVHIGKQHNGHTISSISDLVVSQQPEMLPWVDVTELMLELGLAVKFELEGLGLEAEMEVEVEGLLLEAK